MLRWWRRGFVILLLLAAAAAGLIWYVRPGEPLDLQYRELSVRELALGMIAARSPEVRLSENDLNQLLKQELAKRAQLRPDLRVTGARFVQDGANLQAHVNLLYRETYPVGAVLHFQLDWRSPNLIVTLRETTVKRLRIPESLVRLDPIVVPVGNQVPPPLHIRDVQFDPDGIRILIGLTGS